MDNALTVPALENTYIKRVELIRDCYNALELRIKFTSRPEMVRKLAKTKSKA